MLIVENKVSLEKEGIASKSEMSLIRKDIEILKREVKIELN